MDTVRPASWLGCVLVMAFVGAAHAQTPMDGERCLDASVAQRETACPPTATAMRPASADSALPAPLHAVAATTHATPAPRGTVSINVSHAQNPRAPRVVELAEREAQLIAALARNMAVSDTHRPDTLMRLADVLDEIATAYNREARDLDAPIFAARTAHDTQRAAELTRTQTERLERVRARRAQLMATLARLEADHPRYPRLDEAMFRLAFARQDAGDMTAARQEYLALIQRFPASRYVPNAYLAFAEYFFEQNAPEEARQFYQRVLAFPPAQNPVYGYALYKLSWALYNLRDYAGALASFERVIEFARQHPDDPGTAPLLGAARDELVTAYGAVYGATRPLRSGDAFATFRRACDDDAPALAMLERLGELYQDNGQWPDAIAVWHELMAQRPTAERVCVWQARVARAVVASRPRDEQLREIQRLLDVHDAYRAPGARRTASARDACRDEAARVVYDVASHWHLEAIGRSTQGAVQTSGTRDVTTMARAAGLYDALLAHFPDLDRVSFPEYDRRDWPTRYRVAYQAADLLREQRDDCACGPAFDRVVDMGGAFTEDAAYKSVLCFSDCFAHTSDVASRTVPVAPAVAADDAAPRPLSEQQRGMLRAFTRYACFAPAPSAPAPGAADDPRTVMLTIRYRRAFVLYDARHYDAAAPLLREVALSDATAPDPENLREVAADLYLDALGTLATHARPACATTLASAVPPLVARFCDGTAHAAFCERAVAVRCNARRIESDALVAQGRHAEAAAPLRALVADTACAQVPGVRIDEALFNLAVEYDRAGMLGRAMRVRERLIEAFLPRASPWAQRATYRLAGNYHAIQVFGRAADFYEQYEAYVAAHRAEAVRADEASVDQAADALAQATQFRVGLGEEPRALDDAARFARDFSGDPARRAQVARVMFAIGRVYQDRAARAASPLEARAAWAAVVRHYETWFERYARGGTPEQRVVGSVAIGRGYWNQGDAARATRYFEAAVAEWSAPRPRDAADAGESTEAREAVAEARFDLAEAVYRRFAARRMPVFHGGGSVADEHAWERRVEQPFARDQLARLRDDATPRFRDVIAMHVPTWEMAAYARLADMYWQYARYIRDEAMPPDIARSEDLAAEWLRDHEEWAQRFAAPATDGFNACVARSTELHWFDAWSQLCERGLNAIDGRRYPLADELRAAPTLVYSRAADARPAYALASGAADE